MPDAVLIILLKRTNADATIIQVRVWQVPSPVRGSTHGFKYSLFFGRPAERIVGYDNEAGKGDHRHYGGRVEPYRWQGIDQLLADFAADIERAQGGAP